MIIGRILFGCDPDICSFEKGAPRSLASEEPTIFSMLFGRRAFGIAKERVNELYGPAELDDMITVYDEMTEFRFPEEGSEFLQKLGNPVIFRLKSHVAPV